MLRSQPRRPNPVPPPGGPKRPGSGPGRYGSGDPRRRRPAKLHGDKAYHSRDQRRWLRERGIGVRLARPGIESSQRLGRHRYKVERSIAWLGSYRRLNVRWERKASTFPAMLGIACILTCDKHLAKHADGF
ncbi:transposase [Nocardiopsis akebiae]|uniref:Transposase n=1 Tax=Nocardiopsis akebiae TaxID=2831968 RepID=A0ABX8CDX0_9ACTN|nr:transposase [Nocardiopsis akebiae]